MPDARHCPRCFLPRHLCLCADIPRLRVRTRVLVVRHCIEAFRATNTGRLVRLALEGADLVDHGRPSHLLTAEDLAIPAGACLLFPAEEDAPVWPGGRPALLVVPDGTWPQARRMVRRVPGLADLPRLALPPGPEPERRIRRSPREGARSTLEAVAHALALWEEPGVAEALLRLYDRLGVRMDEAKGGNSRVAGPQ
ncbi:MAG: DTW domain-containing protein [Pseudomonadota bacterium]